MLLSMTGHGAARRQVEGLAVSVEIRTVNSRYYKLSLRATEGYAAIEPRVDELVRRSVRRGTVQLDLRIDRTASPDDFRLNEVVLDGYRQQLQSIMRRMQIDAPVPIDTLLTLPGVVDERAGQDVELEAHWPLIQEALEEALGNLEQMRIREGRAMEKDLEHNRQAIGEQLDLISERAPLAVDVYRTRLTDRINRFLAEHDLQVEAADLIREVGLFAERSDISEEIVRLRSHLEQFQHIMERRDSSGRKLEFVTQEMFRETNTIGSKANDALIAQHVIEIKAAIERIREMIQNVE